MNSRRPELLVFLNKSKQIKKFWGSVMLSKYHRKASLILIALHSEMRAMQSRAQCIASVNTFP